MITLVEEVESNEVYQKYWDARRTRFFTTIMPLPIVIFFGFLSVTLAVLSTVIAIILITVMVIKTKEVRELKKLYKIALHNDMVKHDEKLRFYERMRLEKLHNEQNSKPIPPPRPKPKDIDNSLQKIENKFNSDLK